ncbi:uncharacterized protein NFIA_097250 [Aspergillus fischeri NRRL 181]|uniref:Uncharacterized protein n=1 Tax=Neosartorya fischeri (strain ATCC 1020 / DSM 3700 / CBS 544.65 / FGSC A1164 / JCM 1740 / NRRL 181 / WB 181) TaxID=331117 RepID=A1DB59_NEOFI|nr:uncharacterized protein NFIA_097250 [Aspergillus fischeri NRRL 181]EAW20099.1 hypothetical protein NFIA_097250 [Aspergillus fischeri NRRL 181]
MSHGTSLSLSQNNFIRAPNNEAKDQPLVDDTSLRRQKRQANVYDPCVLPHRTDGCQNAPIRYEENDFYFAHEALTSDCPLPSSDILEAIHAYSTNSYDNATWDRG